MRSSKPPSVKAAVIAKRTLGDSKSQIANDLELSRPTVDRILEECNYNQLIESGSIRVHKMIPNSCEQLEIALEKHNDKGISVALEVLKGCGVLRPTEQKSVQSVQVLIQVQGESAKIVKEIEAFQSETDKIDA